MNLERHDFSVEICVSTKLYLNFRIAGITPMVVVGYLLYE